MFPASKKMYVFDLAVPRDIDPKIADFSEVTLFNIDEIEKQVQRNMEGRHEQIAQAEEIINNEVHLFLKSQLNGKNNK